ncbi:MAG: hypothetical protein IJF07_04640 [Lachnospiraceae bacterium]|nr:hypothetical protein [Lachnospiraceae bacterium]
MGVMEIATITRTQDYTTIKQNEDNKAFVQQTALGQQMKKQIEQQGREVRSSDNSDWQNKKFDAKEKGSNEYSGNGGKKRKQQSKEQVIVNRHQGFDMKI